MKGTALTSIEYKIAFRAGDGSQDSDFANIMESSKMILKRSAREVLELYCSAGLFCLLPANAILRLT